MKNKKIKMTTQYFEKKANGRWLKTEMFEKFIDDEEHYNIVGSDTLKFFRRLGGFERNTYSATKRGYKVTRNVSISPIRDKKVVRYFDFD